VIVEDASSKQTVVGFNKVTMKQQFVVLLVVVEAGLMCSTASNWTSTSVNRGRLRDVG